MIKIIIKKFIRNYQNIHDKSVREAYGILAGALGIICNLFLFSVKLAVGLTINSIAVISDAFNNLTDLGSSLVSIAGAKLSNRPPDKEHPYGHGRFEYISSLVISFIIFSVGLQLLRSSFEKILNPEKVLFGIITIAILILSVLIKLWMFSYNRYIGKTINSSINKATAHDSLNDVLATGAVIIATVAGIFTDFPLDGVTGVAISLLILYSGFSIAKDTVSLLLGSSPDPELVHTINTLVSQGKNIMGIHDLKVHDYGPGRILASIHAEVPDNVNLVEIHSVIDDLEEKIEDELGVHIVIHMDPMSSNAEKNKYIIGCVNSAVKKVNENLKLQNVRVTLGENRINIIFDLLVPSSMDASQYEEIKKLITEKVRKESCELNITINSINLIAN